jgi:hypothetical protein
MEPDGCLHVCSKGIEQTEAPKINFRIPVSNMTNNEASPQDLKDLGKVYCD